MLFRIHPRHRRAPVTRWQRWLAILLLLGPLVLMLLLWLLTSKAAP